MKNSQLSVLIVTILAVGVGIVWAIAPERLSVAKPSKPTPGELCLEFVKKRGLHLRNPASAQLVSERSTGASTVEITISAQNGFGGWGSEDFECSLMEDRATWSSAELKRQLRRHGVGG
jgi:hypothetical protein